MPPKKKEEEVEEEPEIYGIHHGKLDLDRTGFFDDAPPGPFESVDPATLIPNKNRYQKKVPKQMLCKQHGDLFDKDVRRIFEGEVLSPEYYISVEEEEKPRKIVRKKSILHRPGFPKKHSSPGDWYGCIGRQPKHFSPLKKPIEEEEPVEPKPNFYTAPNPVGGPGYVKICMNPYIPKYIEGEPYDVEFEKEPEIDPRRRYITACHRREYFTENPYKQVVVPIRKPKCLKKFGGVRHPNLFRITFPTTPYGPKSGCLNKFPAHMDDPYGGDKSKLSKKPATLPVQLTHWKTTNCDTKTKYTTSIINRVTQVACNVMTYTEYRPQVYPM